MVKNIITSLFSKSIVAFSNLAVLILLANYLGGAALGRVNVLILNIAIVQIINEIYTGSSLVHFIPGTSLKDVYRQGITFSLITTLLSNGLIALIYKSEPGILIHQLCLSFIFTINAFHNVLLLAKQKISTFNLNTLLQPLLLLIFLAIQMLLMNVTHFENYLFSLYASFVLPLIISSTVLMKVFNNNNSLSQPAPNFWQVLKNGTMNQLGNLTHTLSNRLNYYLLGNSLLVGIYSGATSLAEGILIISGSVSPVLLSYVANKTHHPKNAVLTLMLAKLCFALGIIAVCILYMIPSSLFTALLGSDFIGTKNIMLLLCPGILCLTFSAVISHYFSALGMQKIQLGANVAGFLCTLFLAWPLISAFGIYGACYAASAAYFVQALVLTLVFIRTNKLTWAHFFRISF